MWLLLASIVCSVSVSVILKLCRRWRLDAEQAISINYPTAALLSLWLLRPDLASLQQGGTPWGLLLALGVLLPGVFLIMARAVSEAGIVLSDAAQRLSLLLPLAAAFLFFGEVASTLKLGGLALALLALVCLLAGRSAIQGKPSGRPQAFANGSWLLLGVWLGYGLIDIAFKQLARTHLDFSASLLACFVLAGVFLAAWRLAKGRSWTARSTLAGIVLGLFNFGNIYFYLRAHQHFADSPALVFAAMNIGVISLGTLVGAGIFKERLNTATVIGLVLTVLAIALILLA